MGCGNCSSGGCGSKPAGCGSNGSCMSGGCGKLDVFDWLAGMDLPNGKNSYPYVEVRFKNTRKDYFKLDKVEAHVGEPVVVGCSSGYDIGMVTMVGELVAVQMDKRKIRPEKHEFRSIIRKPDQEEIDRWQSVRKEEKPTMLATRLIVQELKLQMKITDVEFQADRSKATFYYTAEDRVDFRELIRILADRFKTRIEMRQIGARQEAGRVGGIGSCGRELCCSTWLTDFRSVSTSAARYQQLAINPLKLAGQCGKLKCCLNYELDAYKDAVKEFPDSNVRLKTKTGTAFLQKTDIFRRRQWYAYPEAPGKFFELSLDRVKEIIALNESNTFPDDLEGFVEIPELEQEPDYENVVGQDSLTRFDRKKSSSRNKRNKRKSKGPNKPQNKRNTGDKAPEKDAKRGREARSKSRPKKRPSAKPRRPNKPNTKNNDKPSS